MWGLRNKIAQWDEVRMLDGLRAYHVAAGLSRRLAATGLFDMPRQSTKP